MRAALIAFFSTALLFVAGPAMVDAAPSAQTSVRASETTDEAPTDDPEPGAEGQPPAVSLSLITETSSLTEATEYEFTLRVTNDTDTPIAAGTVEVRVADAPSRSIEELQLAPNRAEWLTAPVAEIVIPELAAGEIYDHDLVIAGEGFPLTTLSGSGVYRTLLRWIPQEAPALSVEEPGSPIVWAPERLGAPLGLASIIPIVYPSTDTPPVTPAQATEPLTQEHSLGDLIAVAEKAESLMAVDPRIVAYVRALGAAAPAEVRELVDLLTSDTAPTFQLQYGDADPVITSQLTAEGALAPSDITFLTRYFTALAEQVESDTAAQRDTDPLDSLSDGSVPPTLAQLTEWESSHTGFAWPSSGSMNASTLAQLGERGFTQLVLGGADATGDAKGQLGEMTVYRSHLALEEVVARFMESDDAFAEREALAELASVTAIVGAESTTEIPVQALIAFDRGLVGDTQKLSELIDALDAYSWVTLITPSDLQLGTVRFTGAANVQHTLDQLLTMVEAEQQVLEYARVLAEPQLLIDYQRERLISALSVQGPLTDDESAALAIDERVERHLAGNEQLLKGVRIVTPEHTRLLGATSNLPLQFRNTLPFDARVTGSLSTSSAALIVGEPQLPVTVIPAESTITHPVPTNSRASHADVVFTVQLRDTHGGGDIVRKSFDVTLSGATEAIALTTLGALVAALFIGGAWRSARKRKAL